MKKILSGICIALFFSMTFLSCGLDTFYVVPAPYTTGNVLPIDNNDFNNNIVSFRTNESGMSSDFSFDGTTVYYKIFSSRDTCFNSYTRIDAVNNESNYSAASEAVINGYSQLKCVNNTTNFVEFFIVRPSGSNTSVEIRLTNYYAPGTENPDAKYVSYIKINNHVESTPVRTQCENANYKSFDFGWHNYSSYTDMCEIPSSSWNSKEFEGSTPSDGIYYIDLYAIAYGHDVTYTPYYSKPLHLGVIKVKSNSDFNY